MARGKLELLLLRLAALTLMLVILTRTQADPDLWGHVLFGRDIVAARSVPRIDQYAFTSDRPWTFDRGDTILMSTSTDGGVTWGTPKTTSGAPAVATLIVSLELAGLGTLPSC